MLTLWLITALCLCLTVYLLARMKHRLELKCDRYAELYAIRALEVALLRQTRAYLLAINKLVASDDGTHETIRAVRGMSERAMCNIDELEGPPNDNRE